MIDGTSTWIPSPADAAAGTAPSQTHSWKDGGSFSFHDLLDALNPLQHIPVIGTLYRWVTGDQIGNVARIVGDGIYGGPIGAAVGLLNIALKEETGKDVGETATALVTGPGEGQVKIGAATTPSSAAPGGGDTTQAVDAGPPPATANAGIGAPIRLFPARGAAPAVANVGAPIPLYNSQSAGAVDESTAAGRSDANQSANIAPPPATATAATSAPIPLFPARGIVPPATADGAPILLHRPPTAPASSAGAMSPAEQAFVNRNAGLQHRVYGQRGVSQDHPSTSPIPLHLTGPALKQAGTRPLVAPPPIGPPMPGMAAPPPVSALPDNPPVNISQRMMDALDKYARLQQQRGQLLDVSP